MRSERCAGGKGANQASAVAQAGARVKLIDAVGEVGMHLVQGLKALGVDVSDVAVASMVRRLALLRPRTRP